MSRRGRAPDVLVLDACRSLARVEAHFAVGRSGKVGGSVPLGDRILDPAFGAFPSDDELFLALATRRMLRGTLSPERLVADPRTRIPDRRKHHRGIATRVVRIVLENDGKLSPGKAARLGPGRVFEGRARRWELRATTWERFPPQQIAGLRSALARAKREASSLRWITGLEDVGAEVEDARHAPGPAFDEALAELGPTLDELGLALVRWDFRGRDWFIERGPA